MRGVNRADRKLFGSETDQEWDQAASEHTRYHLVGESSGNAEARFRGHDRCITAVHGQSGLDTNEFAGRSEAPLVGRVRAFECNNILGRYVAGRFRRSATLQIGGARHRA
jgi:hypothetical protein